MSKTLIYAKDKELYNGMKKTYEIVSSTLGAGGTNVLIHDEEGNIYSTKDGVTVAKNIEFDNPKENLGSKILLNGANRVNLLTGDGTTTTTILLYNLIDYIIKNSEGLNVTEISKYIDAFKEIIINEIYSRRIELTKDNNLLEKVATISANNDKNLGKLIAQAFEKVGNDGTILIENSYQNVDTLEIVNGMKLKARIISSAFFTGNKLKVNFKNPYYLVYDGEIKDVKEIVHFLEFLLKGKEKRPIVIVAKNIQSYPLSVMIYNNARSNLDIYAFSLDYVYNERSEAMKDIAMITGAKYITEDIGLYPEKLAKAFGLNYEEILGTSKEFIADMNEEITIIEGKANIELLKEKIKDLKEKLKDPNLPEVKKEKIIMRIGYLLNKVAYIKLGGQTQFEIEEKRFRCEDALNTTKQAIKNGIVKGGGITFKEIIPVLNRYFHDIKTKEEEIALKAFIYALNKPFEILINNINENPEIIWYEINKRKRKNIDGFDVKTKKYVNMIDSGIIDATSVLTTEIEVISNITKVFIRNKYVIDKYDINDNDGDKEKNTQYI